MTELDASKRKKLPKSEFAGPGGTYPIPDKKHAANAKARATQAVKAGRMSKAEGSKIKNKADKKLKGGS